MRKNKFTKNYFILAAAIITAAFLLKQIAFFSNLLINLDAFAYDLRFKIKRAGAEQVKIDDIVIIDIDEKSVQRLGRFSSWPKTFLGEVAQYCILGGAKLVAFDIFITESDLMSPKIIDYYSRRISEKFKIAPEMSREILESFDADNELAEMLKNSKSIYLPAFDNFHSGEYVEIEIPKNVFSLKTNLVSYLPDFKRINNPVLPIEPLRKSAKKVGFAHITPDIDGITRNYDLFFNYDGRLLINFSFQVALDVLNIDSVDIKQSAVELYSKKNLKRRITIDDKGAVPLNFYGEKKTFRYISFSDVVLKRAPREYFKDKIVVVGSSLIGLFDLKTTPIDINYPGVELHATFIQNVLQNDFLNQTPHYNKNLICVFIVLFAVYIFLKRSLVWSIIDFISLTALLALCSIIAFERYNFIIDVSDYIYFFGLSFITTLVFKFKTESKEKQHIKNTFSKYVSPTIIEAIMKEPEKLRFGGENRYITALFTDVKDFAAISESVPPEKLTEFMRAYMNEMTEIVFKQEGMLDKYIGDAIVALFGAPVYINDHSKKACFAAFEMKLKSDQLRNKNANIAAFKNLDTRFGVNSGDMIIGNMGSDRLFDYTAIGDEMNLASRLENLNKIYGTSIIISERTAGELDDNFLIRELDCVYVKGKKRAVRIYELQTIKSLNSGTCELFAKSRKEYEEALNLYYKGEWDKAAKAFKKYCSNNPSDKAGKVMLERIIILKKDKKLNWDGVYKYEEK